MHADQSCAQLQIWDPDIAADTSQEAMQSRHKVCPYMDQRLQGRVQATFVRGQLVFDARRPSAFPKSLPCGKILLRPDRSIPDEKQSL